MVSIKRSSLIFLFLGLAFISPLVANAGKESEPLVYDSLINSEKCQIVFPPESDLDAPIDFCGANVEKGSISGWNHFVNKGGWPQSFMTSITQAKDGNFRAFIVEFSNSGAHTSFLKSFAKWHGGMNPYK